MAARSTVAAGALLLWLAAQTPAALADVKPNALISEGMVLQRETKVRLWGTADPGERVTVKFRDQEIAAEPEKDGRWSVQLESKQAGGPFALTIEGKNKIHFENVLVGEVWVCSGQSNMEWPVARGNQSDRNTALKAPANPMLRLFTVRKNPHDAPVPDVTGSWVEAGPKTIAGFSAVGYFFGCKLQADLKVPVGLIHSSWGGTRAEAWTSRQVLEAHPMYKAMMEAHVTAVKNYPTAVEQYEAKAKEAKEQGKPLPKPPANPSKNANSPSVLYNGMIAPLLPYAIRGVIWYQGESNAGAAYAYRTLFPLLIKNWRDAWGSGDFPFLFVQLAPWQRVHKEPTDSSWAELREAQLFAAKLPHTGMAVITDLGHEADIHPTPKQPVGERLALIALATVYHHKLEYSGPVFTGMKIEGNKAILHFSHLGGGLEARELVPMDERRDKNGKSLGFAWRVKPDSTKASLIGFTVAGEDRKFHNAKAEIEGETVIVSSAEVARPVAVRYGWADHPLCNLFNKAGLPASPFRTDDFPVSTQPRGSSSSQASH